MIGSCCKARAPSALYRWNAFYLHKYVDLGGEKIPRVHFFHLSTFIGVGTIKALSKHSLKINFTYIQISIFTMTLNAVTLWTINWGWDKLINRLYINRSVYLTLVIMKWSDLKHLDLLSHQILQILQEFKLGITSTMGIFFNHLIFYESFHLEILFEGVFVILYI